MDALKEFRKKPKPIAKDYLFNRSIAESESFSDCTYTSESLLESDGEVADSDNEVDEKYPIRHSIVKKRHLVPDKMVRITAKPTESLKFVPYIGTQPYSKMTKASSNVSTKTV